MLYCKDSKVHGKGCYTSSPLKKGDLVAEWRGLVSAPAKPGEKYYGYYVKIGDKWLAPRGAVSRMNHSCEPNTAVVVLRDGVNVVALRDIMAGEELLFDYGTVISKGDPFTLTCTCGARNCREVIQAPE
jgi:uncharacterized protein